MIVETARGILCISTTTDFSKDVILSNSIVKSAISGKKTILNKLNSKAFIKFPYFLPYKNVPSMKIATAAAVPPSMCRAADMTDGIEIPIIDRKVPNIIDRIKGFFESLSKTCFNPFTIVGPLIRRNSRTMIDVGTTTTEMEAADKVAKRSASPVEKAKIMKGIPKKAKLPNIVLKIKRKRVSFFSLKIMEKIMITIDAMNIGIIPEIIYLKASLVKIVSAIFTMNNAGSAK